jgi:tRNA A37 threonylcarbamoyladenosine modification protein TsaB
VVGVSSLEVLAYGARVAGWDGPVVAVIDGRRGEVFTGCFSAPGAPGDLPAMVAGPERHRPDELAGLVRAQGMPTLVVGDGALRYAGELAALRAARLGGPSVSRPAPVALALLAWDRVLAGAVPDPPEQVGACYLRDADVRINWAQRRPPERPAVVP